MNRSRRIACAIAAALLALGAAGCEPEYARLNVQDRTIPPQPATIGPTSVDIAEGIAVGVLVDPIDDSEGAMPQQVALTSSDETIFGCDATLEEGSFVLYGVSPGKASMFVELDGELVDTWSVDVAPQPP